MFGFNPVLWQLTTLTDGRIFQTIVPLQRYTIQENYVWIRKMKSHKLDVKTDI
jgi:hypothetical protein